jgi:hypothetical protein
MLNVEVRATAGGRVSIFWYTTGHYAGVTHAAGAGSHRRTGAR